jgi:hypothetical protein
MPTSPERFRKEYRRCSWIFDLFAHGFDFLNGRFFPRSDPVLEDMWDFEEEKIKRSNIDTQIISADGAIPPIVRDYLDLPGDAEMERPQFYIRLFSLLSVIDRLAGDLNYLSASRFHTGSRWAQTADHFERRKQLQKKASGYVVFKPHYFMQRPSERWLAQALRDSKKWKKIPRRGEDLDSYFQNLLRLSGPEDCELEFRILNPNQDFPELDWETLRVGIVPLIEQLKVRESDAQLLPGPLVIKKESSIPSTFGVQVEAPLNGEHSDLCSRAEEGLRYLAEQGCQIALFPEMVMPDPTVAHIQNVLEELALQNRPRPGLVLGGTFTRPVPQYSPSRNFNVAVVLNHRGEELWRQRKMHPYEMQRYEQQNFGLETILNSDSCRENITVDNRKLRLVDSPATGIRMVVLICEDATRDPGLRAVRELRPTLILAPVMAGPLEPSGGFGHSVSRALQQTDSIFVVANSAALARAAWGTRDGAPPLAIVGLPLLNVPEKYRPLEVLDELHNVSGTSSVQVLIYQFPR